MCLNLSPLMESNGSRPSKRRYCEKITKIKQQEGPDLHVYGSSNLLQTLLKHDLVDAFWLKIFPITLGRGKRLFADGTIPAAFKSLRRETSIMPFSLSHSYQALSMDLDRSRSGRLRI